MTFGDVVIYCAGNAEFVENIDRLYGLHLPKTGLDRMIDDSTGHDRIICAKFCAIVYDLIWSRLPPEAFEVGVTEQAREAK